ncbi:MAG TPA: type III pantothenate kinase [Porticoccaceae bacterium]|nr:type III pantothenate kinase [Porticoccaceae bacterium]HIG66714.1 type III pantothenate kinase [Porticoccaceae bacterium]HIK80916.1 type III pantothenate kinase [Porticoccaceae bacterium]
MILDIDIGNSYAKWRLTDGAEICQSGSQATTSISDGLDLPSGVPISRVRLSSVASDSLQSDLVAQMKSQFNAEVTVAKVSSSTAGVICGYDDPSSLGIDRWLAMVASYSRYQASVLVVDAGSAMTLDLVSTEGRHIGGYILPGLTLMRDALWGGTDRVKVDADAASCGIDPAQGTVAAVNQGSLLASIATIEKLRIQYQSNLVVTGGDAKKLLPYLKGKVDYQPNLVLDGLALGVVSTTKV